MRTGRRKEGRKELDDFHLMVVFRFRYFWLLITKHLLISPACVNCDSDTCGYLSLFGKKKTSWTRKVATPKRTFHPTISITFPLIHVNAICVGYLRKQRVCSLSLKSHVSHLSRCVREQLTRFQRDDAKHVDDERDCYSAGGIFVYRPP